MGRKVELALGVLNGAIGDHLAKTGNGLATELTFVRDGEPAKVADLSVGRRAVVLVHGLMCTEDIFRFPDGDDYGSRLERELGLTALRVRYNTGLAIPENGRALARLFDALAEAHALEELVPIGYSMGGLVIRSACHHAGEASRWLPTVRRAFYVGTPHRGAPLERAGRVLTRLLSRVPDPYAKLVAEVAELRSAGIQDLGDAVLSNQAHPVPLLASIRHHLVAGSLAREPWLTELFGDAVVPLSSGTDGHRAGPRALPPAYVRTFPGLSHVALAHHDDVYAQLEAWMREPLP